MICRKEACSMSDKNPKHPLKKKKVAAKINIADHAARVPPPVSTGQVQYQRAIQTAAGIDRKIFRFRFSARNRPDQSQHYQASFLFPSSPLQQPFSVKS